MKLNTELKSIFKPLAKYVNTKYKKDYIDKLGHLCVFIKTPNIFYRKQVVYCKKYYLDNTDSLGDITDKLNNNYSFTMKDIQDISSKAYINYFTHYQSTFNDPYYKVTFKPKDGEFVIDNVSGSISPDPIDKESPKIRK